MWTYTNFGCWSLATKSRLRKKFTGKIFTSENILIYGNLNPPIFLQWWFRAKLPNLIPTNIPSYNHGIDACVGHLGLPKIVRRVPPSFNLYSTMTLARQPPLYSLLLSLPLVGYTQECRNGPIRMQHNNKIHDASTCTCIIYWVNQCILIGPLQHSCLKPTSRWDHSTV